MRCLTIDRNELEGTVHVVNLDLVVRIEFQESAEVLRFYFATDENDLLTIKGPDALPVYNSAIELMK